MNFEEVVYQVGKLSFKQKKELAVFLDDDLGDNELSKE